MANSINRATCTGLVIALLLGFHTTIRDANRIEVQRNDPDTAFFLGGIAKLMLGAGAKARAKATVDDQSRLAAGEEGSGILTEDGSLHIWGADKEGSMGNLPHDLQGLKFRALEAGREHFAGITTSGELKQWGDNSHGECNVPTKEDGSAIDWKTVACGQHHTIALSTDDELNMWGDNEHGQITLPDEAKDLKIVAVAAGGSQSAAITSEGRMFVWGQHKEAFTEDLAKLTWKDVSAGFEHMVGLTDDDKVHSWGKYEEDLPEDVQKATFEVVSAGGYHTVGITTTGRLMSWGSGEHKHNLCDISQDLADLEWQDVAAGWKHTLAISKNGRLLAWGDNGFGQCDVPKGLPIEGDD